MRETQQYHLLALVRITIMFLVLCFLEPPTKKGKKMVSRSRSLPMEKECL